jgi:iron complex outermembrane receptor protein
VASILRGELNVTDRFVLNAGARLDYYFDRFGSTVNPRVAAIYSPRETTRLKALFGTAFRAATAYDHSF